MVSYITIPLVEAYQKARAAKADDRKEKRSRLKATIAEAAARLRQSIQKALHGLQALLLVGVVGAGGRRGGDGIEG